ncbi:hypothetical protein HDA32_004430 [Spinactinospora alkalitolerans]|uniref:Uncharacterized protein n=1 Tax=Spinactinospora alkalitolerans TaxID=687207 RepID=A0A852U5W8_9ACTN|nr:hypothetical protein [Spinactinospora alkalitolerans]NYE49310.1 hypothetical protein [Spinactinospora alkalitolerans]
MEYRLTADLTPPAGQGPLDELQQLGAAALLLEWLERIATVEGPDGAEITPYDHEVDVAPGGAVIRLLVDAPALDFAENGAEALLQEILQRTELLADWRVARCEVTVTDAELVEAVALNEDTGAASRAPTAGVPEEVIAEQRRRLLRDSARFRAFALSVFGPAPGGRDAGSTGSAPSEADGAALAAGALVHCASVMTEELFMDVLALDEDADSVVRGGTDLTADDCDAMFVLHDLPPRYRHHYDAMFAKRFLVASAGVFSRLTRPEWRPPVCTAEALALHLLVRNAKVLLTFQAGLDEETVIDMMAAFNEAAYDALDHEWLYLKELDAVENGEDGDAPEDFGSDELTVRSWFRPADPSLPLPHPYLADEEPGWT